MDSSWETFAIFFWVGSLYYVRGKSIKIAALLSILFGLLSSVIFIAVDGGQMLEGILLGALFLLVAFLFQLILTKWPGHLVYVSILVLGGLLLIIVGPDLAKNLSMLLSK